MEHIILMKESMESGESSIYFMPHPKNGNRASFLVNRTSKTVMEVMVQDDKFRTWFNGGKVISGNFCVATEVHIIFMVLPYFIEARDKGNKFQSLDQIVVDDKYPSANMLVDFIDPKQLSLIADKREVDSLLFYRFNEDLTMKWLSSKVNKLQAYLLNCPDINVSEISKSNDFVEHLVKEDNEEKHMVYAYGMICDYINRELAQKLREFMKIPEFVKLNKFESEKKRRKIGDYIKEEKMDNKGDVKVNPTDDYSKGISNITNKPKKLTLSQKKLDKVDKKGMKSISSFFAKK